MQNFNFAHVVPHRGHGVAFADGTVMLQRQGWSTTLNGNLGRGHLEIHLCDNYVAAQLFYLDGSAGPQLSAHNRYSSGRYRNPDDPNIVAPVKLQEDALNWIERTTHERLAGIRQDVCAYMYSEDYPGKPGHDANDILLMRYRYDSATRGIFDIDADTQIAEFTSERKFAAGDVSLDRDLMDDESVEAFEKVLRPNCFHATDVRQGIDHCMRRLAWLASEYYLDLNHGKKTFTYVLKRDAEHPAELSDLVIR